MVSAAVHASAVACGKTQQEMTPQNTQDATTQEPRPFGSQQTTTLVRAVNRIALRLVF